MSNLQEVQGMINQFKKAANEVIAFRNLLNGRLNFPVDGRLVKHEFLDQYWEICNALRSEFG